MWIFVDWSDKYLNNLPDLENGITNNIKISILI